MRVVVIPANPEAKAAADEEMIRDLYELLGSNMTQAIPDSNPDWRGEECFQHWRREVFLGKVQRDTRYVLVHDAGGLRGFVSFTAPEGDRTLYLNEVQIRPSAQGDGVTLRRLLVEFAAAVARLPHDQVRTYANAANVRSNRLLRRAGFNAVGRSDRGVSYCMAKDAILRKLRVNEIQRLVPGGPHER